MATLDAERTRAANLDIQISTLDSDSEDSLSALRAQRTLVQERLNSYRYPVLTLPNEIVSEIFVHFLPVYPEHPPRLNGIGSPNNLTQICRKWRDIAMATPALWKAIQLSIGGVKDIPFERQVLELDAWLSRSRSHPFSIEVSSDWTSARDWSFISSAVRAARWENLKANLNMTSSSSIIGGSMPLLRHLDLKLGGHPDSIVFREVPLLRSVVLDSTALIVTGLPWAQLTSLTLKCVFPEECVPILQQTTNIVHCKLLFFDHSPATYPDVTLPRLEFLSLAPDEASGPRGINTRYLETFVVPALWKLHIDIRMLIDPIDTLTSFMLKSGCSLREMYISGGTPAWCMDRDSYFRAFPSVEFFFFDEEYPGEAGDLADLTESESDSESL